MSSPAPALRSVSALAAHELRLTARRGENVLVTLVIPIALLLFFGAAPGFPDSQPQRVADLVPGIITVAIIASGLVSLGISTAYERSYGVLKRLGTAPLPPWGLLGAKVAAILVLEVVQVLLLLVAAGIAFGWRPGASWSPVLLLGAVLLGTFAFTSLGLLLAGTLRAEAVLALANAAFLGLLMVGGVLVPVDALPNVLQPIAALLPSAALTDLLAIALGTGGRDASNAIRSALVLVGWGSIASAVAIRLFRWD
jgi:ABC-2 type transport system permease protein